MKNSLGPPQRIKNNALVDFYCCDKNTTTKHNLGREGLYFSLYFHIAAHRWEISGQEFKPVRNLMQTEVFLVFILACSYGLLRLLFINPGPPVQDGIAHSELSPPTSITSQENVLHITFATDQPGGIISQLRFRLPRWLWLITNWYETSQHNWNHHKI